MKMLFSVVIPTYNGQEYIARLIKKLVGLLSPYKYEITVIDSQSMDNTVGIVKSLQGKLDNLNFLSIKKAHFNHGKTRNLGVKLSKGKYVCFISQDALPISKNSFKYILEDFNDNPGAVAVFSKDIPGEKAPLIQKLDLTCRYEELDKLAAPKGVLVQNPAKPFSPLTPNTQMLWWGLSNVFACYKKSFLVSHPFPKTGYGEDLMMGKVIVKKGLTKIYDARCRVLHSHNYNLARYLTRQFIDFDLRINKLKMKEKGKLFCKITKIVRSNRTLTGKLIDLSVLGFYYLLKISLVILVKLFNKLGINFK